MSRDECFNGSEFFYINGKPEGVSLCNKGIGFNELHRRVIQMFPDAAFVFSKKGVSKKTLLLNMQYIALATHHDIRVEYPGGHSIIFYCGVANIPTRKQQKHYCSSRLLPTMPCRFHSR